jgi:hypothetical protein
LLALSAPTPASAFPCADLERSTAPAKSADCRAAPPRKTVQTQKRGSVSSLAVLVVALTAVLLIPIGSRGIPSSLDPYSRERSVSDRNRRTS